MRPHNSVRPISITRTRSKLALTALVSLALLAIVLAGHSTPHAQDPLSSWNDGTAKQATVEFVANTTNRYLLNSPMLPQLKRDADGGLTLIVQNESPGKDKEVNWLPAPKGPFAMVMRLYWPKAQAMDGTWKQPPLQSVK